MLSLLVILKRNPLAVILTLLLLISVAALAWKVIQVRSLTNQLTESKIALTEVRITLASTITERDRLRQIIERNNAAVAALNQERQILDEDFAALRKQLEETEYEDCLDAVNSVINN